MSEKTKQKSEDDAPPNKPEEKRLRKTETKEKPPADKPERSYYYDDAYGYEIYDPNEPDEDE